MRRALAFLTPLGGSRPPDAATLNWFPVVGALLGAALGALWWGAGRVWTPAVAAVVTVTADLAFTGLLHLDGLADSADGLLAPMSRQRRLEVMADPATGAFGVGVVVMVLALRIAALAALTPSVLLLSGLWCGSRTVMAVAARREPYARESGLATAFRGGDWRPVGLYGLVGSVSLGALAGGRQMEAAVAVGLLAGFGVIRFARARVGGFTGDVLGAAGMLTETVGLLVAAARW